MAGESQLPPENPPDPSTLTIEQILRSIRAERDWALGQFDVRDERFRGIDRATEVLNEAVNRAPTEMQKQIGHLRELLDERMASVAQQFKERDTRSERESRDNKVAVDAAFAAQKEAAAKQDEANQKAIDKSEKATNETISKNADAAEARANSLSDKIDDVKLRINQVELLIQGIISNATGNQQQVVERRAAVGSMQAMIGFVVMLVMFAAAIGIARLGK